MDMDGVRKVPRGNQNLLNNVASKFLILLFILFCE